MKYKFKLFSGLLLTLFSVTLASCSGDGNSNFVDIIDPADDPKEEEQPKVTTVYTADNFTDYFDENFMNPYQQNYVLTTVLTYNTYTDKTYEELDSSFIAYVENRWFDGDVMYKRVQNAYSEYDNYYLYEENDHLDLYVYRILKATDETVTAYLSCQTSYSYIYKYITSMFRLTSHSEATYPLSNYNWVEGEETNTFVTTDYDISWYLYTNYNSFFTNTYTEETPFETTVSINSDGSIIISINVYPLNDTSINNTTLYIEEIGTTEVDVEDVKWDIASYSVTYSLSGAEAVAYVYDEKTKTWSVPSSQYAFAAGTKVGLNVTKTNSVVLAVYLDGQQLDKDSETGYWVFEMKEHNVTITALC